MNEENHELHVAKECYRDQGTQRVAFRTSHSAVLVVAGFLSGIFFATVLIGNGKGMWFLRCMYHLMSCLYFSILDTLLGAVMVIFGLENDYST